MRTSLRHQVARLFQEARRRLEILEGRSFRSEAYRKATETILGLESDEILTHPEQYRSLRGIGSALARKIEEIIQDGTFDALERLRSEVPDGVLDLLNVRGLGPSAVRQLWQELGVTSLEELLKECEGDRLPLLKGWTERRVHQVCEAARWYATQHRFRLYSDVASEAETLLHLLRDAYIADHVELTGEYRRRMPLLQDLDILFVTSDRQGVLEYLSGCQFFEGEEPPFQTVSGLSVNCHFTDAHNGGPALIETTGSAAFREMLPSRLPVGSSEEEVFRKMGWPCVVPEMREGCYSPEFLRQFPYERLVTVSDIQGLVHVHTTWSDGIHSLEEIVEAAHRKGFEYIAICDHSQSSRVARGLGPQRFRKQWEAIERVQIQFPDIRILRGVEVDILSNGTLDLPDDLLTEFDVVVASIHQPLDIDEDTATQRLLSAIHSGQIHILGHPTGRLLTRRPGYPIRFDEIFEAAAQQRVAIEINANPYRLDLDWQLVHQAVEAGCYFSIDPDAHSIDDFDYIRYGVYVARKGALLKDRVLNTRSVEEFLAFWQ